MADSLEAGFFASLLESKSSVTDYFKLNPNPELFVSPSGEKLFKIFDGYVRHYGDLPTKDGLLGLWVAEGGDASLMPWSKTTDGVPKYYLDRLSTAHTKRVLKKAIISGSDLLNNDKVSDAETVIQDAALSLLLTDRQLNIINYATDALTLIHPLKFN